MKLLRENLTNTSFWKEKGFITPQYDIEQITKKAKESPKWLHFGIGNIFRVFIGGIADDLLSKGYLDRGLTGIETFDYEIVDKIYEPYDNLGINVILNSNGTRENHIIASISEVVKAQSSNPQQWSRLKEIFKSKDLQLASFTITEKGYALTKPDGSYFPFIKADIENGPEKSLCAITILTSMLLERYKNGQIPVALVSMDNCSQNGSLLKKSVITIAKEWLNKKFVDEGFINDYLNNEKKVTFPWTMIDKITPRPSDDIANYLEEKMGLVNMHPIITSKRTYIAPFVNAENPQYLVIEDNFPNGRPQLEYGKGVYMANRETVNLAERMKVTACLNPVHSALGPLLVVLGINLFADGLKNKEILKMGKTVAYGEGLPVVKDPKIISPLKFTDELFNDRFINEYLGDTNLRLSTDVSQGVGVRFGETIKAYVEKEGSAEKLIAIPLGIAGWLRYMMGIDDMGNKYELAPDPMNNEFKELFKDIQIGNVSSFKDQLKGVLSNKNIFFVDLYQAGVGKKIEDMFREMISGLGATKATVHKYFGE